MQSSFFLVAGYTQTTIGLFPDTDHAPFVYGVASGDPTPSNVLIWTAIDAPSNANIYTIHWEIALDEHFRFIAQAGITNISPASDWTLTLDIGNLKSYTTYYYRFKNDSGDCSVTGRTRTAPVGDECGHIRLALNSCASLSGGYFNSYARIAERRDLDLVVCAGDYIYNTVDSWGGIRIPESGISNPQNLDEWRDRYRLYLLEAV